MKVGVWCCLLFYLHGEQWWRTGGPWTWWHGLYTQPHKVQLWRHRPQHPTKFRSPSAANAAEPEEIGKGQLCNFFLAAWRGKCASACFIKPPVWAIVRTKRLPGQTRGNLRPTFLYTFVSGGSFTSKSLRQLKLEFLRTCNPSILNKI